MLTSMQAALVLVAGYLAGSLPVADTVARRHRLPDLRATGDRNPGFWNASQLAGRPIWAILVGDAAKGSVAAGIGLAAGGWRWGALGGGAAVVGHCWPLFVRFRGGRGVATFVGVVPVLAPVAGACAAGIGLVTLALTRRVEWAIRIAVFAVPVAMLAVDGPGRTAAIGSIMTVIGWRFLRAPP